MNWIAVKMLLGDRSKYAALVFGISFACFLMVFDRRCQAPGDGGRP